MKTIKLSIKQIVMASFLTILILGGNVSAKGTEIKFVSSLENSVEPELNIEDWMINDSHWNVAERSSISQESEKSLNVENWMTDENYWKPLAIKDVKIVEEELEVDNWMINKDFWDIQR